MLLASELYSEEHADVAIDEDAGREFFITMMMMMLALVFFTVSEQENIVNSTVVNDANVTGFGYVL